MRRCFNLRTSIIANFQKMKRPAWILLILPIVTAIPADENKPLQRFKNGSLPLVVPKRTTLDEILKAYNIPELETRPPSRMKREDCGTECQADLEKKLRENTIDLIVAEIYAGNYTSAKTRFLEIGDQDLTYTIAEKMASKPNNENLLKFIKTLPWLLQRMIGYEALVKRNNLGLSVFTLEYHFNDLVTSVNDPNVIRESQHIIDFVRKSVNEQINAKLSSMVTEILTKQPANYNDMIVYSKDQQKPFNAHLDDLVEKAYQNTEYDVDNVEQILAFSNALTQIGQSGQAYTKLYKLMEEAKEFAIPSFLKIAFKVKELTLMNNYKNTADEIKKQMEELKEKVPAIVRSIIWGQVCIKHEKMGKFLHENGVYDSKRRSVALSPEPDRWEFETNDDAKTFKIRHVKTNEYLYADIDELAYSTFKRRVFTWMTDGSQLVNQYWVLEDLKWRQGKFFIKNKRLFIEEYLNGEEMPEQAATVENITPELDAISKKDAELAARIKQLIANSGLTDRFQAFTWRRHSRGNQPEWLIIDSSNC